ncbi:MAG TPA: hypothetical protein VLI41_10880 [Phenylobacterium sp.]|uniref:hypothetical protein n=1 Tax=Phenylobacterium sp. TaxID=1871053 RepID=UPI002C27C314|nr:hypothetical protein [Phenylobacterium sp.]HSV03694.1 hypothetical protein [Phenylobacterium sp.]
MRTLILTAALVAALATPAAADTLQEVTTHGMVLMIGDMPVEVNFTPDGKFTAGGGGDVFGVWRIDGDKLCTTSNYDQAENCVEYPKGKKSGDSFEVTGPQGSATVKIK